MSKGNMNTCWKVIGILLGMLSMAACARPDDDLVETRHGTSQIKQVPEPAVPETHRRVEGPSQKLQAIDSLMWRQPDSALAVLMDYLSDDGRDAARHVSTDQTFDNHYTQLLVSELLYKNDCEQTNRQDLQKAVYYFDSLCACRDAARHVSTDPTIAFLDARAHYINGVGYYEHDSVVEACKEYLKALEVMDNYYEEKELIGIKAQQIAITYTHLTNLFSNLYLHEEAIYFGKKSLGYYSKYDANSWHISWILNEIGTHYDMMDVLDSADYYYKSAIVSLEDTNTIIYRDVATHQACLKYKQDSKQANNTLVRLLQLLSDSENDIERLARCENIGELYYREQKYDSAWYYLSIVFQSTSNIGTKKQAAECLAEICKMDGKTIELLDYTSFLAPFANQEESNSGMKSQLTELYNVFKQIQLNQHHHRREKKLAKRSILVFGGMFVLLFTILSFYHKNMRSKQQLESLLETERQSHKLQQAALAGRLRQSNEALKAKDKMKLDIDPTASAQPHNNAESYTEEPICKHILAICSNKDKPIKSTLPYTVYADIALNYEQKAQLKNAATRHYGLLFEELKQQYPQLKEKDYYYCYLSLLGLDNVQISALLQQTISTIWSREQRLKKLFDTDNAIAIFLHSL